MRGESDEMWDKDGESDVTLVEDDVEVGSALDRESTEFISDRIDEDGKVGGDDEEEDEVDWGKEEEGEGFKGVKGDVSLF